MSLKVKECEEIEVLINRFEEQLLSYKNLIITKPADYIEQMIDLLRRVCTVSVEEMK